jgi:Tol biopolymer transport system component
MTAHDRSTPRLEIWLAEEGAELTPDYLGDVLARTTTIRQRPAWASLERWLPMTTTLDRARAVNIPPAVRYALIAALIAIVALAGLVLYAGQRHAVPAPFGVARNGHIAYVSNGDVYTFDPVSGATTRLTSDAAIDDQPTFSLDGTRLAFRRGATFKGAPAEDIVVANADGSNPILITPSPIRDRAYGLEWAPDGRSLLVGVPAAGEVRLYDTSVRKEPKVIARDAFVPPSPFQPPNGTGVLLGQGMPDGGKRWFVHDLATGADTTLAVAHDPSAPRWSPDGTRVVFVDSVPTGDDTHLLFIVDARGTDAHRATKEAATWAELDPVWSPDGTRIAFTRLENVGSWSVRPVGIVDVATGVVTGVGPLPRDVRAAHPSAGDATAGTQETFNVDWSPDGRWLLAMGLDADGHLVLIDTATGDDRVLDAIGRPQSDRPATAGQAWQRTVP